MLSLMNLNSFVDSQRHLRYPQTNIIERGLMQFLLLFALAFQVLLAQSNGVAIRTWKSKLRRFDSAEMTKARSAVSDALQKLKSTLSSQINFEDEWTDLRLIDIEHGLNKLGPDELSVILANITGDKPRLNEAPFIKMRQVLRHWRALILTNDQSLTHQQDYEAAIEAIAQFEEGTSNDRFKFQTAVGYLADRHQCLPLTNWLRTRFNSPNTQVSIQKGFVDSILKDRSITKEMTETSTEQGVTTTGSGHVSIQPSISFSSSANQAAFAIDLTGSANIDALSTKNISQRPALFGRQVPLRRPFDVFVQSVAQTSISVRFPISVDSDLNISLGESMIVDASTAITPTGAATNSDSRIVRRIAPRKALELAHREKASAAIKIDSKIENSIEEAANKEVGELQKTHKKLLYEGFLKDFRAADIMYHFSFSSQPSLLSLNATFTNPNRITGLMPQSCLVGSLNAIGFCVHESMINTMLRSLDGSSAKDSEIHAALFNQFFTADHVDHDDGRTIATLFFAKSDSAKVSFTHQKMHVDLQLTGFEYERETFENPIRISASFAIVEQGNSIALHRQETPKVISENLDETQVLVLRDVAEYIFAKTATTRDMSLKFDALGKKIDIPLVSRTVELTDAGWLNLSLEVKGR